MIRARRAPPIAILTAITVAALVTVGEMPRANAAEPSEHEAQTIAAEALFTAGRADVQRGDFASACPKFAESQRLDPAVGTLINLADCEEQLGHLARAWQLWREAVERLSADDARRPVVVERATAIDKRVPRLTVRLARSLTPPDPALGLSIRRDDVEVPSRLADVPLPVDPGDHVISLSAVGHLPSRYPIKIAEGASETVVLELGPKDPSVTPPAATNAGDAAIATPKKTGESSTPWLGYGLLGAGAVGVGLGAVTGLVAIDKKKEQEDNCFPITVCNETGSSAARAGSTFATVSTVSFVAGGALALAGLYFVLRGRSAPATASPAPASPRVTGVSITTLRAGLGLGGAF